jgi:putative transposase
MPDKGDHSHRKPSRLEGWDYASPGWYFVTICTKQHRPFFGQIQEGEVRLSCAGGIVDEEWKKTPNIRPYVALDVWVIMPNHMHGILRILPTNVGATGRSPLRGSRGPASHSVSSIVAGFKSAATKRIHSTCLPAFAWQRGYYDHIIRDDKDLHRIRQYIADNPAKWEIDRYYVGN